MAIITLNNNSLSSVTSLPAGVGGKVLQVVSSIATIETTISSQSFADTGLSASITPSSTSSKIFIMISQTCDISDNTDTVYGGIKLLRGTTSILEPGARNENGPYLIGSGQVQSLFNVIAINYLDSPSTTSATTYKTQGAIYAAQDQITFQKTGANNQGKSIITLMEIAG